jgi:hypothetical protein
VKKATGTFSVKIGPLSQYNISQDAKLARMSIDKQFNGDLVASAAPCTSPSTTEIIHTNSNTVLQTECSSGGLGKWRVPGSSLRLLPGDCKGPSPEWVRATLLWKYRVQVVNFCGPPVL